ncbi:hypothetical protein EJ04DRAFT_512469 [Polyplosphaeria fusca]|uniref:Uncharacterized protein n=1 Tax=Polyplosphaeria fusca TaxID=682080 RepID=A0A9P4V3N3_9PLEO|nr:hypothetical protein EJ04DRAFT_512469 [Polyplosphaeria fusca]
MPMRITITIEDANNPSPATTTSIAMTFSSRTRSSPSSGNTPDPCGPQDDSSGASDNPPTDRCGGGHCPNGCCGLTRRSGDGGNASTGDTGTAGATGTTGAGSVLGRGAFDFCCPVWRKHAFASSLSS